MRTLHLLGLLVLLTAPGCYDTTVSGGDDVVRTNRLIGRVCVQHPRDFGRDTREEDEEKGRSREWRCEW